MGKVNKDLETLLSKKNYFLKVKFPENEQQLVSFYSREIEGMQRKFRSLDREIHNFLEPFLTMC